MKPFRPILCALLLTLVISACSTSAAPLTPAAGEESMKGYELYSWKNGDEWYFSILIGTNREKTVEEIQSSEATLKGIDDLKAVLESIPAGQYVTWTAVEPLKFPPDEIIQQVEKICSDQGLNLSIAN